MKTDRILSFLLAIPWTSLQINTETKWTCQPFSSFPLMTRHRKEALNNNHSQANNPILEREGPHLRVMAAGNMNPMDTAAVAPVNWKASQMLGMKLAPKKITAMRPMLSKANLLLSDDSGLDIGKTRPSKLSRRAKNTMGNTNMRWST